MKPHVYWKTIFSNNKMEDYPSDISYPDFPSPIMGDVIFHNVQLLNHYFGKGKK